ncbi:hypothetical protein LCGC14_2585490 [marine sediment metagenome]|uniref:Uncharacterized protein n=1 Tax=marine sediment metagenome TaxID=412755 RepID=A0A0F9D5Y7_9ZZZZ
MINFIGYFVAAGLTGYVLYKLYKHLTREKY